MASSSDARTGSSRSRRPASYSRTNTLSPRSPPLPSALLLPCSSPSSSSAACAAYNEHRGPQHHVMLWCRYNVHATQLTSTASRLFQPTVMARLQPPELKVRIAASMPHCLALSTLSQGPGCTFNIRGGIDPAGPGRRGCRLLCVRGLLRVHAVQARLRQLSGCTAQDIQRTR